MILALCPNPSVDKILHLDHFRVGEVNRCHTETAYPGGKGVHVGLALKELGDRTKIIGFWGGPTGEWIRRECQALGIPCYGPRLPEWTRTCITMLSEGKADNTEILEKGPTADSGSLSKFFNTVRSHTDQAKALCVSGSWPVGVPGEVYETLGSICTQQNLHFWADASGDRLIRALRAKPYGIHINKSEAAAVFGNGFSPLEYTGKLLDICRVAALTDGANGLFLGTKNGIIHASHALDHEQIVSTVGAGDCLTAGLLHAWYNGSSPEDAAVFATACGAANCVRGDLGMLYREDVDRFKKNVELTRFDKP